MQAPLTQIRSRIAQAMGADRHRLRQQLARIEAAARANKPTDRSLAQLTDRLERSIQQRAKRCEQLPRPRYPGDLPVIEQRETILRTIAAHQVVVLCGATGSGKSTQLPKLCLELGRGIDGMIGHTQPRRLAARTLAARIAEELRSPLGKVVGYKVRFGEALDPDAYVKLMTDGILLAETQSDPYLSAYDTLILDEAHERSLNIDFLLGYLKTLLPKRPDLKLIITSATIDPQRFADHFAVNGRPAPIIEVSGRSHPVEVRYRPPGGGGAGAATDDENETAAPAEERDLPRVIADALAELQREGGDVLVFLPTERDIREAARALRKDPATAGAELLPLYARLSPAEQQRIFTSHGSRRIVLATNVAETSLTVPGIRHVIDTGLARISRYSARAGVQRLPIEPISQASAEQRKGRCGRTSPGVCIRLYSEEDFAARDVFTPPEVLRTNLASVILQMKALRLGSVEQFAFLEPPRPAMVRDGYETLRELGAINDHDELTPMGARLAVLPVDPRIGRMIMAGEAENCLSEMLIIAAALEVAEPRLRPPEHQQRADEAHSRFADEQSDFMGYLKLWDFFHELKRKLSHNRLRVACQENFLSHVRLREWVEVHRQLRDRVTEAGLRPRDRRDDYDAMHRALLTGLLWHVALRTGEHEYTGAGGRKLHLWPGSGLFKSKPRWIVAAELVETSRLFARTAARINPDWIEPIAKHLVSRSYSEPHWQEKSAHVGGYEKVSLFGLTIVPRRRVHYGPVDPKLSRELFIHHALVEGEFHTDGEFFEHNRALIKRVGELEAKARRRDLLADQQARHSFYDDRLPAGIYDGPRFEKWREQAERDHPRLLFMSEADLLRDDAADVTPAAFPDSVAVEGLTLPLKYRLAPGEADDGMTLTVPMEALNQLDAGRLAWGVPGRLEETVLALIRSLPKSIRRNFVPAPERARQVTPMLEFGKGPLLDALAAALGRLTGVTVPVEAFKLDQLDEHLRMNVRVIDDKGEPLAEGRDLAALHEKLGTQATASFAQLGGADALTRAGMTNWDFDELPAQVNVTRAGMTMTGHPALIDEGSTVALRVLDTAERAARETRRGVMRLCYLQVAPQIRYKVDYLPQLQAMRLHAATVMDAKSLTQQLGELIAARAFVDGAALPRDRAAFDQRMEEGWNRLGTAAQDVGVRIAQLFEAYHAAALALADVDKSAWREATMDVREQMAHLMPAGFLTGTPYDWLIRYPRYFTAIHRRLEKLLRGGGERDRQAQAEFAPPWRQYLARREQHAQRGVCDPQLDHLRWMLEEYRVSLFAQELGTALPVSAKRIEKQWAKVRG